MSRSHKLGGPKQIVVRMMYELDDAVAENVIKNSKVPLPFRDKPGGKEIGKIIRLFREGNFVMGEVEFYEKVSEIPNLTSSEIFGVPRMQPVLNAILDIRKIRGAAGEGYWRSCFASQRGTP